MIVLLAVVAFNVFVWVALVCAARWQGAPDQMCADDSDAVVGAGLVSVEGYR